MYLDKRKYNDMTTTPIANRGRVQQNFITTSNCNLRTPLSNISNGTNTFHLIFLILYVTFVPLHALYIFQFMFVFDSFLNSILTIEQCPPHRHNANISAIPFLDLTSNEDLNDHYILKDVISGLSKDYLDHGDETLVCAICHAKLWKDEARRGNKSGKNTYFSMCCGKGKVELPELKESPPEYLNLYRQLDPKSKYFMKNIRRFNSMFSFTSMGGKIDSSINKGNAPYTFRFSGQNYHTMGSLLPSYGSKPKFSQLYIYDTENEISNRQNTFSKEKYGCISHSHSLDIETIQFLKVMLDSTNELVKWYRRARYCFSENPHVDLKLRLIGRRQTDGRTYNLPTASEVAALIVGDIGDSIDNRDIIVTTQSGRLQHINELHPAYLALQYPLLFPYGDDEYRVDIPHRGVTPSTDTRRRNCTMREFFAYRIQDRPSHGNTNISNIGERVILPSSFTGGARYMMQNYLDAVPGFFITVTCNPKWPEIKRFLKDTTLNPKDRPNMFIFTVVIFFSISNIL
uniref:Helitron helicase-like domain-containing protein n=1 Tax=Lactuca sativa TaxID=4236 RepID=A0A9R1UQZ2_LACSA|nr:hypothetical protein LSAT_V11C800441380 [Lactuca sativa]